jgi:hypothetical protein
VMFVDRARHILFVRPKDRIESVVDKKIGKRGSPRAGSDDGAPH